MCIAGDTLHIQHKIVIADSASGPLPSLANPYVVSMSERWQDILAELRSADYSDHAMVQEILDTAISAAQTGGPDGSPTTVLQQLQQARELYSVDQEASQKLVDKLLDDIDDAQALLMLGAAVSHAPLDDDEENDVGSHSNPVARSYGMDSRSIVPASKRQQFSKPGQRASPHGSPTHRPHAGPRVRHPTTGGPASARVLHADANEASGSPRNANRLSSTGEGGGDAAAPSLRYPAMRPNATKARSWYVLVQEFLQPGLPGVAAARQRLQDIIEAAELDTAAKAAGVPMFITALLQENLSPAGVVDALQCMLNQVVRPIWAKCRRCGVTRLARQQMAQSTFQCGHPAALFRQRVCGAGAEDAEYEWFVTHDTKLLRWNLDYGWFQKHTISQVIAMMRGSSPTGAAAAQQRASAGAAPAGEVAINITILASMTKTWLVEAGYLSYSTALEQQWQKLNCLYCSILCPVMLTDVSCKCLSASSLWVSLNVLSLLRSS